MADATLADMITRVLQKLSVLQDGETAEAGDSALISPIILAVNEQLRTKEICHWSDAAFPLDIKEDLAEYVACFAVGDYPSSANLQRYGEDKKRSALAELRRLTASKERVDRPTRACFY